MSDTNPPSDGNAPPAPEPEEVQELVPGSEADQQSDEGFESGSQASSLMTSIATQIRRGIQENGRTYAAYGRSEYGLPQDEREAERTDMQHEKYFMLLNDRRYLAPIGEHLKQVLDLGTGTGIWSMDFADAFPSAQVTGVDISPIQPTWVPPNCHFEVDDIEATWTFDKSSYDFIFARDLFLSIRDFPALIQQCYDHLKPGGWIEFECILGKLGCDDDSLTEESGFKQFDKLLRDAAVTFGTNLEDPGRFKQWFEEVGFVDAEQRVFKVPCSPWPKDKRMKLVGLFERENFLMGLEALSMRVFQKALGWSAEEVEVLLAKVKGDVKNPRCHAYYPFYVVYARKPDAANPT